MSERSRAVGLTGTEALSVPADLVRLAKQRLIVTALLAAAILVLYDLLNRFVWRYAETSASLISASLIATSLLLAVFLRGQPSPRAVSLAGLGYQVLTCLGITVLELWSQMPLTEPLFRISTACVLIVLFASLVPARPSWILGAALLSATTIPLGFLIAGPARGYPMPRIDVLTSLFLPGYLCALLAYAPAKVITRLRENVSRARQVGSYELIERLGVGGMGEVWRAHHRLLARPAAVKIVRPEVLSRGNANAIIGQLERFEREAQITATLESLHTVELYDFGVAADGVLYYVMELLRGVDLETLVKRFGPQPAERVVHILLQICDSLDEAHGAGLVHRDIKPANVYLARKGGTVDLVKVLDFGLVKIEEPEVPGHVTSGDDTVRGTPAYMAPEQSLGSRIDSRTDLYAVGCVAYWLLTGQLVFDASSTIEMAVAHANVTAEPPSQHTELPLPPALDALVLRCLHKDPSQRPASARALAGELAAIALETPWSVERARAWWSLHLPGYSSPASLSETLSQPADQR